MLDYEIVSALLCITCVDFMGARVNVRMQCSITRSREHVRERRLHPHG